MTVPHQQLLACGIAVVCTAIASFFDIRERRIPNLLNGGFFAVGLALHLGLQGWRGLASSLLAAGIAGGFFLLFYLAGGMGAGDVKLMTSVAALVAMPPLQLVLLSTVAAGALCALVFAVSQGQAPQTFSNTWSLLAHHTRRGPRPHARLNLANQEALRLPFAVPVAMGCVIALCASAWKG